MFQDHGSELSTASTSAMCGTHILDLDSKSLHAIFSLKRFSILDFCSIGETHDRFKQVVDDVFAERFKNYGVNLRRTTNLETITRILSNFGPLISLLSIYGGETQKITLLLDLMAQYCSSTLDSIKLTCLPISEGQTIKLQQIFGELQKISLIDCTIDSGKKLFSNCYSLVELELYDVKFGDQHLVLENTFPKLDRFEYVDIYSTNCLFGDFFSRHQNLKSLRLTGHDGISHLLPGIADNCKQLAELKITFEKHEDDIKIEKALTNILTFDHLNKLEIHCNGQNITKFIKILKDLKSLEILRLCSVECDPEFVAAISKLTTLQELELCFCRGLTNLNPLADLERLIELKIFSDETPAFDLVGMIKRLINLKTLVFLVGSFKMDKKMYLRIVDVVRERPGRLQDALQISCRMANGVKANSFGDKDCRKLVRIIK